MRHENDVVDVAVVADAEAEADTDVADADAPTADVYRSRPASAKLFSGSAKNASINRSLSHRTCCSKICAAPASISSNVATSFTTASIHGTTSVYSVTTYLPSGTLPTDSRNVLPLRPRVCPSDEDDDDDVAAAAEEEEEEEEVAPWGDAPVLVRSALLDSVSVIGT